MEDVYPFYLHNNYANVYADLDFINYGLSPKEFGERYIGSSTQRKRAIMRKRGLLK